ncbi:hypothetical protein E2542_SST21499 [Spatholobus suberectus]|nr:hypothetical protein E2542_SST21499 [Spatholobus suberectus]
MAAVALGAAAGIAAGVLGEVVSTGVTINSMESKVEELKSLYNQHVAKLEEKLHRLTQKTEESIQLTKQLMQQQSEEVKRKEKANSKIGFHCQIEINKAVMIIILNLSFLSKAPTLLHFHSSQLLLVFALLEAPTLCHVLYLAHESSKLVCIVLLSLIVFLEFDVTLFSNREPLPKEDILDIRKCRATFFLQISNR